MREDTTIADDPRQRFALTLHVGMGKTGTTSLQAFLRKNRRLLAQRGWLYPRSIGPGRHAPFGMWLRSDEDVAFAMREKRPGTVRFGSVEELRREVPRLISAEARRSGVDRVLMSDEALFGLSEAPLRRLRHFADAHATGVRIVCYLRRQDDHVVSRYQQSLKWRETRTLVQLVTETDLSWKYDYYSRLRMWLSLVRPDQLVVRRFEPSRLLNGSLYDDFVEAAALGIPTDKAPPGHRNETLVAEAAEFLRLLNLYRVESGDHDLPDNRSLQDGLREVGAGPTLTLPQADLDRFMARWAESNSLVARDLLGEPDGVLFRQSRRTRGTTAEQRFDPTRLDDYLEVLPMLPTRIAAHLHRIAVRESERRGATPGPSGP